MTHEVTLVPGDHTGPELIPAVRQIIEHLGVSVNWDPQEVVDGALDEALLSSARRTKTVFMGHYRPIGRKEESPIVTLRRQLGVFANVRPIRTLAGLPSRYDHLDLVVVRETTEDIYAHLEHQSIPNVFESLKVTTRPACERIARFAFEYAQKHGREKITIVHKSNIMKRSDGLFLRVAREVAADYPEVAYEDVIVDALCMRLVLDPNHFDVLLCGNLYGDIVSDLCGGIAGGPSNCPSANFAEQVTVVSAPHGDPDPQAAGTDRANPLVMLLPATELLTQLGEHAAADRLRNGIERTLMDGIRPIGIGGDVGTRAFTQALLERL